MVLPGVGSFPDCKKGLEEVKGLVKLLTNEVINNRKKFLGICVGMQLMVDFSLEKQRTEGFSWLDGYFKKIGVKGLDYLGRNYKIPHIGWNKVSIKDRRSAFSELDNREFYFQRLLWSYTHHYFR